MPLRLILGPANSAKAGEVLGSYADAAPRGGLLIVPSALDAQHYSRELAGQGTVLHTVLTFAGLAGVIATRTGSIARALSDLQRERVLKGVIDELHFEVLEEAAGTAGFVPATARLIAELERSLVSSAAFESAMAAWGAEDERRASYAREVSSIYSGYVLALERISRVDRELHAWRALDALRAAPNRWGADPVFFYGFDDLHPLERDAIETLSRVVGVEVTVSLTYEPGRAALGARAELVEELRPLAQTVLELPASDEHYAAGSRAVLHHLERRLFEGDGPRLEPGAAVRLLEAGGQRAEVELAAAEVMELLRDGVEADEIVVVLRRPAGVAPLLERVFGQSGISVAIEHDIPFDHTALGRGLLGLARCSLLPESGSRAEDVLDYLRTPGLLDREEVADWLEAVVRREGLRTATEVAERLGWDFHEIDALREAPAPAHELARQARRLLARAHRGSAAVLEGEEELDARALRTLLATIEQLDELDQNITAEELIELLEGLAVRAGSPPRAGAVVVSDPLAIRARRFRAVLVLGLQEREFPLPEPPEPFLSDERRLELARVSGPRLRLREDSLARERYLFYSCVSRASERVILSYCSSDEEGNLAVASPFIADVAELLVEDWPERRRRRLLADVVWPPEAAPTERELRRAEAAASAPLAGEAPSPDWVLSERALEHVRHRQILSGGALEAYAACPVKWLIERELRPTPLDPDPDPLLRGSFMHAVLEQLLRRLGRAITPESLPDALSLLDQLLSELPCEVGIGSSGAVRAATLRSIQADLRRYLRHEAADGCGWRPRELELRFGFDDKEGGESLPPLVLGDGEEAVPVRGAIDRVDVDPSGTRAIVRDYKSGGRRSDYPGARWQAERRLQVPLYMLAVRELLGLTPAAGLYQPLGGDDLRARGVFLKDIEDAGAQLLSGDGRTEEELRADLDGAAERALELAARLRAGELSPCPETCSRDGCRYPGICRIT